MIGKCNVIIIAVPVCDTWLLALAAAAPLTIHASQLSRRASNVKHQETAGLNDKISLTFLDDAVAFGRRKGSRTGTAEPSLDMPFWEGGTSCRITVFKQF